MFKNNKKKGFSLVELVIVIAILAILIAVLAPSLMTYTERSRAQKDITTMDEVVNAVQLSMADQDCYDEMLKYSCNNNFITYTDSSGNYGQVIADGEYWAPDGLGRATTITFNPEKDSNGDTIYRLENAIVNDMTFGNGSVAENRVMQGTQIDNNQCYLKNASLNGSQTGYLYNRVRQIVGDDVFTTSATYANSSFTIFIKFNQKDGVTVADVNGSFNGTNLSPDSSASKGSGTTTYDPETKEPIVNTEHESGATDTNFTGSALQGTGSFSGSTVLPDYKVPAVDSGLIIPSNGEYITSNGEKFTAGDEWPELNDGDIYKDAYYEYRYNQAYFTDVWDPDTGWENKEIDGWGVRVLSSSLAEYGTMLSTINNKPVSDLSYTFYECKKMTTMPKVSDNTKIMESTFAYCYSLTTLSPIPNGTEDISRAFLSCYRLRDLGNYVIPGSVFDMTGAFESCDGLTVAPIISKGVKDMTQAFYKCTSLEAAPTIPEGVTDMWNTFRECSSLTTASSFPSTVKDIANAYGQCRSLTVAPIIPHGVEEIGSLFNGCIRLNTYVGSKDANGDFSNYVIPNTVTRMNSAFENCQKMVYAPSIPESVLDMWGSFKNCTSLISAPTIPSSVRNMSELFYGCTSLSGTIVVKTSLISKTTGYGYNTCTDCFKNTTKAIVLVGTGSNSNSLNLLKGTANNSNVTIQ